MEVGGEGVFDEVGEAETCVSGRGRVEYRDKKINALDRIIDIHAQDFLSSS